MHHFSELLNSYKSYLKSSEIAKLFNVDHSTVFLWVKKKQLKPIKTPGGNFRFAKSEVERLFRATRNSDAAERRKYPRFAVSFPVVVSEDSAASVKVPASLTDVSLGGLGLTISKELSLYDNLKSGTSRVLRVFDTDSGVLRPEMEAEVRHVRDIDEEKAFVGLLLRK